MKLQSKIKIILFLLIVLLIIFSSKVLAASISVGPSKSSVSPGESFSVTITSNGATGKVNITVSNGTASSSSLWLEPSGTITVTAGSSGTIGIRVTAVDMSDAEGNEVSPSGSASVSIVVPQQSSGGGSSSSGNSGSSNSGSSSSSGNSGSSNSGSSSSSGNSGTANNTPKTPEVKKSSDATLKSLQIEGLELYPEFNPAVNEYNVKVTNDITAVKINAETNDSKASYVFEGIYEGLVVGENVTNVIVTAEDGTTNTYVIKINKDRDNLKLQTIKISYVDETGINVIEITPEIQEGIFDYTLEDIPYYVTRLDFEVLSNFEEAKVEINGDKDIYEGENTITVTITMPPESEELEDEELTYTFIVNKEVAPKITFIGKIQNWFKNITGTVATWYVENQFRIVVGSLMLCSAALGGLSVYLVFAYRKYQGLIKKLAEITRMNVADETSTIKTETVLEGLNQKTDIDQENIEEVKKETTKPKGRHF